MSKAYIYVVARDFGFAPNPFHGCCTLATCKPRIRSVAKRGDWVIGMGGTALKAVNKCVFAMCVTDHLNFNEYWKNPTYSGKRPVRNGSSVMLLGDNIYHTDSDGNWLQEDSHHSKSDGSPNPLNIETDTRVDRVLVSKHFYYFGNSAPCVPTNILDQIKYVNRRDHRTYPLSEAQPLIDWIEGSFGALKNQIASDPFNFSQSNKRYAGVGSKITD
jgi:Nucleotide modification associated domain 2